jgi:lipopolysaccharide transport system ATP-binding protein
MLEVGTGFNGEMTGRENVYMNGAILGMTKAEIDAKMEDIIEFSEVRDFIDTPVKRYSSGMYVKLAFSVAAHLDSEIMIMDEVLAVGDMAFQKKCLDKMREAANEEGRTVLYVSHNMNTIRQLCDRCVVLDKGKKVFEGDTEEAIGVYTDVNSDTRIIYDYGENRNSKRFLQMLGVKIKNKESNSFFYGEEIQLMMQIKANKTISDVYIRFEVYLADKTIVGTAISKQTISAEKGEIINVDMSFSTQNFAPGKYGCAGLLFEKDQYGNQVPFDRVDPAFTFEILPPETNDIVWLHQWWGHIRLDDVEIERVQKTDKQGLS